MTRQECIRDLKGSMELFLFDPDTGEMQTPEQLNELNRMTYEAMAYAVRELTEFDKTAEKVDVAFREMCRKANRYHGVIEKLEESYHEADRKRRKWKKRYQRIKRFDDTQSAGLLQRIAELEEQLAQAHERR